MTEGPDDIVPSAPKSRVRSGVLRFLEIVAVWGLILGFMAVLGWGISDAVRDSLPKIDRNLAALKTARADADLVEVQARTVDVADEADGENLIPVERAPPEAVDGATITNPRWTAGPQPQYPDNALRQGAEGSVTLSCRVTSAGDLDGCAIVEETPAGLGFGAAAIEATRRAKLAPRTVDGVAQAGTVRFTVRFKTAPPMIVRYRWPWEHSPR